MGSHTKLGTVAAYSPGELSPPLLAFIATLFKGCGKVRQMPLPHPLDGQIAEDIARTLHPMYKNPRKKCPVPRLQSGMSQQVNEGPEKGVPWFKVPGRCRGLVRCTPACLPERKHSARLSPLPCSPRPSSTSCPPRELCAPPRGSDSQFPSPSRSPGSEKPPYRLHTRPALSSLAV